MTKTDVLERPKYARVLAWLKRMEGCGEDFIWRGAAPTRSIIEALKAENEALKLNGGGCLWVPWDPHSYVEVMLCDGSTMGASLFELNLTGDEKPTPIVAIQLGVPPQEGFIEKYRSALSTPSGEASQ